MLYAILCYHDEDAVGSWSKEQDAAVMKKLSVVQDKLTKQGRLGPVARLLPTTAATAARPAQAVPVWWLVLHDGYLHDRRVLFLDQEPTASLSVIAKDGVQHATGVSILSRRTMPGPDRRR